MKNIIIRKNLKMVIIVISLFFRFLVKIIINLGKIQKNLKHYLLKYEDLENNKYDTFKKIINL